MQMGRAVQISIPLASISKVDTAEHLEFAKATMRIEALEADGADSLTPDEYYFSFACDPLEVVAQLEEPLTRARAISMQRLRSQSSTPQAVPLATIELKGDGGINTTSTPDERRKSLSSDPEDKDLDLFETDNQSTTLPHHTYPPGSQSAGQFPRAMLTSESIAWTTWMRKQLAVPANLPFPSRIPFIPRRSNKRKLAQGVSQRGDTSIGNEELEKAMSAVDRQKHVLYDTFGLSERETLVYSEEGVDSVKVAIVLTQHIP